MAAFLPLLQSTGGRVVNVGSGSGPSYVKGLAKGQQALFCSCPPSVATLETYVKEAVAEPGFNAYGLSKACVSAWTMILAREHPNITFSCTSPGFIKTAIVGGYGATKPPEEGTVSTRPLLFKPLAGNGWYYGSDAKRSP